MHDGEEGVTYELLARMSAAGVRRVYLTSESLEQFKGQMKGLYAPSAPVDDGMLKGRLAGVEIFEWEEATASGTG